MLFFNDPNYQWRRRTGLRHFTVVVMSAGILMTVACAMGPDYAPPAVETPSAYKETGAWKIAEPGGQAVGQAWWERFGDPLLSRLAEQVAISNQNVAAAEAQVRQAQALLRTYQAGYAPTLSAGASITHARSSGNLGTATGGAITTTHTLPLDFSWELDIWGKVRRTVEAGRADVQASAADLAGATLSARATLAQSYFQLRTIDAQKRLYDQTIASLTRFLELTRNRYASGVASRADVLQAGAQLSSTQAQAIDLDVQRAQLEHAIAVLVGQAPAELSIPQSDSMPATVALPPGLPSELLERRPDIASAERQMAAANARIGVAEAAYFPTITLSASGGLESMNAATWFAWPSRFWSLGPTVSALLLDGGLRRAQTEQARATYDAAVATYRQTVLTAFQEVEDNLATLRVLESEATVQASAVSDARQALSVTTNQYQAGTASALDVIDTQVSLLNAERSALTITGSRISAGVLLIKALGGGWHADPSPEPSP